MVGGPKPYSGKVSQKKILLLWWINCKFSPWPFCFSWVTQHAVHNSTTIHSNDTVKKAVIRPLVKRKPFVAFVSWTRPTYVRTSHSAIYLWCTVTHRHEGLYEQFTVKERLHWEESSSAYSSYRTYVCLFSKAFPGLQSAAKCKIISTKITFWANFTTFTLIFSCNNFLLNGTTQVCVMYCILLSV